MKKISFVLALLLAVSSLTASSQEVVKEDLRVVKSYKNYEISNGVANGELKFSIKNYGDLFEGSVITEINFSEIARQPVKLKTGKTVKIDIPLPKDYKNSDLITVWAKGEGSPILYNEAKGTKRTLSGNIGYQNVDSTNIMKEDTLYCYVKVKNNGEKDARTIAKVFFMSDDKTADATLVLPFELKAGEEKTQYPKIWVTRPQKEAIHTHMRVRLYYEDADYDEADLKEVIFPAD